MIVCAILSIIGDAVGCYSCDVFGVGRDMETAVGYKLSHVYDSLRNCDALIPYDYFDEHFATDFKYSHVNDRNRDYLLSCDNSGRDFEFYLN